MKARPVPQFVREIRAHPTASPSLTPGAQAAEGGGPLTHFYGAVAPDAFALQAPPQPAIAERFHFSEGITVEANAAVPVARFPQHGFGGDQQIFGGDRFPPPLAEESLPQEFEPAGDLPPVLAPLKPRDQLLA